MEKIKALSIATAVNQAIEETAADYLILQKKQWEEGKQSNGDDIQLSPMEWFPGYSPGYKRRREFWGLQTSHVDLDRTHAFYDELQLQVEGEIVNLTSEVDYEEWITHRFGKAIYGLNEANIVIYRRQSLLPAVKEIIRVQSGLTFGQ